MEIFFSTSIKNKIDNLCYKIKCLCITTSVKHVEHNLTTKCDSCMLKIAKYLTIDALNVCDYHDKWYIITIH